MTFIQFFLFLFAFITLFGLMAWRSDGKEDSENIVDFESIRNLEALEKVQKPVIPGERLWR